MIFIYKALLHVLPVCLTSFISFRTCNLHTHPQETLILGKTASQVRHSSWTWSSYFFRWFQMPTLFSVLQPECFCELWSCCACLFMRFVIRGVVGKESFWNFLKKGTELRDSVSQVVPPFYCQISSRSTVTICFCPVGSWSAVILFTVNTHERTENTFGSQCHRKKCSS